MKFVVSNPNLFKKGCILLLDRSDDKYIVEKVWKGDTPLKRFLRFFFIRIPISTIKVSKI